MKKIEFLLLMLVSIGIGACQLSNPSSDAPKYRVSQINQMNFDVLFDIQPEDKNIYNLSITMQLDSNNYIISPFSTDSVYGHFKISIPKNESFIPKGALQENPLSVEEFDPIITWPVRFVRETTTYTQQLQSFGEDDFRIEGLVEFLLEPSCVPYDVAFDISQQNGSIQVEKGKTIVSAEYKLQRDPK